MSEYKELYLFFRTVGDQVYSLQPVSETNTIEIWQGCKKVTYTTQGIVDYVNNNLGGNIQPTPPAPPTFVGSIDLFDGCTNKLIGSIVAFVTICDPSAPSPPLTTTFIANTYHLLTMGKCTEVLYQSVLPTEPCCGSEEVRNRVCALNNPLTGGTTTHIESSISEIVGYKVGSKKLFRGGASQLRIDGYLDLTGFPVASKIDCIARTRSVNKLSYIPCDCEEPCRKKCCDTGLDYCETKCKKSHHKKNKCDSSSSSLSQ